MLVEFLGALVVEALDGGFFKYSGKSNRVGRFFYLSGMFLAPLALTATETITLVAAVARGPHPRMRRRAQAVLGHHRGTGIASLAAFFAVSYNTASG